ncbi:site-specific integrase [Apibacter muscae]|nr:site-specific integrase [Apibacter muscae]
MASVTFVLKSPLSKERTSIILLFRYDNQRIKIYTKQTIEPLYWDKDKHRVKNTVKITNSLSINNQLQQMENLIFTLFDKFIENYQRKPLPVELKEIFEKEYFQKIPQFTKTKTKTFFDYFDQYIQNKKIEYPTTKTHEKYTQVKNSLKEFEKYSKTTIIVEDIDLPFRNHYIQYLQETRNYAQSTIHRHLKFLKTVLLYIETLGNKLHPQLKIKGKNGFIPQDELSEKIALSEKELAELENLDLSQSPRLEQIRDRFLIGCYTGLRFSDFIRLNKNNIEDQKYILIRQQKTQKSLTLPFFNSVKKIFEKYNYELPKPISEVNFNLYLKEVAKQCKTLQQTYETTKTQGGKRIKIQTPRYEQVSTHTARRTFVTLNHAKGVELDTLMLATGHANIKTIRNYVKLNDKQNADLLGKRIEEAYNSRDKKPETKIIPIANQ